MSGVPSFRPRLWLALAIAVLTVLITWSAARHSLVIDDVRYFWVDDDQMISMRYARNLVEGHGLVWNPGERVEGYTNPLWTLAMAAAHLLPVGEAKLALVIKAANWLLACAILILAVKLLRALGPIHRVAWALLPLTLALDPNVVYWAAHGYEVTPVTALYLLVILRLLREAETGHRIGTFLLLGLLPLLRSDGYHLFAGLGLLALGLSRNRRQTLLFLAIACVLPAVHVLWRLSYYGELLPNTYHLKVVGVAGRLRFGFEYLVRFLRPYGAVLGVAIAAAIVARDRRRGLLLLAFGLNVAYVLAVGGDAFRYSRFLAYQVPVILVLAMASGLEKIPRRVQVALCAAVCLSILLQIGVTRPGSLLNDNGLPREGVLEGVMIRRHTEPGARVAVFAAGCLPYFSHRTCIDFFGKVNPRIARLAPRAEILVAHQKFDPAAVLESDPDLVATNMPHWLVRAGSRSGVDMSWHPFHSLAQTEAFRARYLEHPIPIPRLKRTAAIYVSSSSPELSRIGLWREPRLDW